MERPDARPADVKVHYSNNKNDRGSATDVDRFEKAPGTDMALLHLATHHPLPTYPKVTTSYKLANFAEGDPAEMYGYGLRNHDVKSDWLYRADVLVWGLADSAGAGHSFVIKGVTGASNAGDSGAPVFDPQGRIIAVNVVGGHQLGDNIEAKSEAVDVTHYRDWIRTVSGV